MFCLVVIKSETLLAVHDNGIAHTQQHALCELLLPLTIACIKQMQDFLSGRAGISQHSWHGYTTEELQLIVQWQREHLEASTGEAANKDDLLGCLADVNEAAAAGSTRWEIRHIHIALLINLCNDMHSPA